MLPKNLVFGGGGTRCLIYLSALSQLQTKGFLKNVESVIGTSAGSLIGSLFLLSKDAARVKDILFHCDFTRCRDVTINNLFQFNEVWGLDDGKKIKEMICDLCEEVKKGSSQYCLKDVPGIRIVVADLTIRKTIILDSSTYPNLLLVDAIRASMCLPILFRPFITNDGHIWTDGGLRENFPWLLLTEKERSISLGFAIAKSLSLHPLTLNDYIFSLIHFEEPHKEILLKSYNNIIWFEKPPFPNYFTRLQKEDYELLETRSLRDFQNSNFYLRHLQGNYGNPDVSVDRCIPQSMYPENHKVESSDTPSLCHEQVQDSSLHQSPYTQLSYRRWSV